MNWRIDCHGGFSKHGDFEVFRIWFLIQFMGFYVRFPQKS